jgi:mannose-6-phosphate isomerase-like protein (cupin superfamily)
MRGWVRGVAAVLAVSAGAATAQAPGAADHASKADIAAQVARMEQAMKPGQGFAWERLVGGEDAVAGLEIWRKPGKPAVHPTQAEYATVVKGEGVLVSGGTLADRAETRPDLVEGSRIEGGVSRPLRPGDVIMIPAGMPHWFGITGRELVLLGTKLRVTPTR